MVAGCAVLSFAFIFHLQKILFDSGSKEALLFTQVLILG